MTITKEGAIASFYTVNKAPIKHLKVYFSPKQDGSGNPSPENIREINGWNNIETRIAGKNLASAEQVYGILSTCERTEKDGRQCVVFRANQTGQYDKIKFKPNTQYTISCDAIVDYFPTYDSYSSYAIFFKFYYTDGTSSGNLHLVPSKGWQHFTATSSSTKTIQAIGAYSTEYRLRTYIDINTFQIEEGTQATTYEPYKGTTQTIDWSSTLDTIYGGYIDLITGELVQEQIGQTFKGSDADQVTELTNTNKFRFRFYKALKGNGTTKAGITYCNKLQYQYNEDDKLHYYFTDNNSNGNAYVYLPKDFGDNDEVTIVASLYTPELVATLSPMELQTFIGRNNIWSNADRVEVEYDLAESNDELYRRRNIILQGAPHKEKVEDTIAHFNTDLDYAITEAKIHFLPAQIKGTLSPSNIIPIYGWNNLIINQSGKNMLNCNAVSDGTAHSVIFTKHINDNGIVDYINCNGTMDAKNTFRNLTALNDGTNSNSNNRIPRGHISLCTYGNNSNILPLRPDGNYGSYTSLDHGGINASAGWYDWDTTTHNDRVRSWVRIQVVPNEIGTIINENVYPMMCHYLDRGCNFEPYYGNTTSITFPALGKNLLDITKTSKLNPGATGSTITISNGVISIDAVAGSARTYVMFSQTFPAGTYTIQAQNSGAVSNAKLLCSSEIEGSTYNTYYTAYTKQISNTKTLTFTLTTASTIGLVLPNATNESGNPGTLYNIQLEQNSSATTYEPYNNTIYGGYLDLIKGELVQTHQKLTLNGTNYTVSNYGNASYNGTEATNRGITIPRTNIRTNGQIIDNTCFCDTCTVTKESIWGNPNLYKWHFTIYNYQQLHIVFDNATVGITSDMDWTERTNKIQAWLANNNITVVLPLETPIHYPLTPQTLKTFKGTNNIWSNANDIVDIQYWTH